MISSVTKTEYLSIADIMLDGGTQSRARLNTEVILEYAEALESEAVFPPVVVFYDGKKYWLADGFHRLYAAKKAGRQGIAVEIYHGSRRDALLYSVGANASHGLRRTNADKRRAVEILLQDEEWNQWSNREIAKRCGVSEFLVRQVRETICDKNANSNKRIAQRQGKAYILDTTNIGDSRIAAQIAESKELDADFGRELPLIPTTSPQQQEFNDQNSGLVEGSYGSLDVAIGDDTSSFQQPEVQSLNEQQADIHQLPEHESYSGDAMEMNEFQDIVPNKIAMEIRQLSPEQLAWVISVSANNGLSELHLTALIEAAQQALDELHQNDTNNHN